MLSSVAGPAHAQPSPSSPGFEYRAPAVCPAREQWIEQVSARVGAGATSERLDAVLASVSVVGSGQAARVRFRGADAAERTIEGRDCVEVLTAAALITALALASDASTEQDRALPAERAPEPAVPAPPASRAFTGGLVQPADAVAAARPAGGARPAVMLDAPAPAPGAPLKLDFTLGGGGSVNTWLGPEPLGSLDLFLEVLPRSQAWSLRLSLFAGSARAEVDERTAKFGLWGAALGFCPLGVGARWGWHWSGCGDLRLGRSTAKGDEASRLAAGAQRALPWGGAAAVTRVQTPRFSGVRLELEGGALAPFWHREFQFEEPDASVFATPMLGWMARVGLQVPLDAAHAAD